jgi:thymidylate synthase (FAD)
MDKSDSFFSDVAPYPYFQLGRKDKSLIKAVIKKNHQSVLEHCSYNFFIEGLPRYILQELTRHRMASYSVQSSRYTLSKLKGHEPFIQLGNGGYLTHPDCGKYVYLSGNQRFDIKTIRDLDFVRECVNEGFPNDEIKQILPEAFLCNLMMTINVRSFRNFLELRTDPSAHFLIQELAFRMYDVVPESHKFLFDDCVNVSN